MLTPREIVIHMKTKNLEDTRSILFSVQVLDPRYQ